MSFYPLQTNIYENDILKQAKKYENKLVENSFKKSINGLQEGVIPKYFNQNILNKTNKFKIHEQLKDIREHNIDTNKEVVSSLSGVKIPMEEFSHNNMVPFFGSNIKQNMSGDISQTKLETFTGNIENYKRKSEIPIMFEPEKNVSQVYGTQIHDNELFQRYISSSKKQNELPINQIRVGPGLNQGYSSTPCGGLNQTNKRDFIMPKTVDELRTVNNPKKQYKGRIISGQKEIQRGKQAKVNKNRPDRYYNNCADRYFTTAVTKKPALREKVRAKRTNRQCSTAYSGVASATENIRPSKRGLYRKSRNNCYKNSGTRNLGASGNWTEKTDKDNYGKNAIELPLNERDTTQKNSMLLNLTTMVKSVISPVQDLLKTSKKENFIGNVRPTGNFGSQMPKKMTIHDPNDIARTTIKETNIHDVRNGNINGPIKLKMYDPNDITRTTIKETNIHDNRSGNINSISKLKVYDPNDITRTTIKEMNIHDVRTGGLTEHSGSKQKIYQQDDVKTTVRNTLEEVDKTINLQGNKRQTVYDPNDIPQATIKDTNIHHTRSGNMGTPGQNKADGYLTKGVQAPNTNKQFTSDNDYTGNSDGKVGKGNGKGYLVSNYDAKNVNRQFLSDNDYTGVANSEHEKPKSYKNAYNASLNYNKEKIAEGRSPTKNSTKVSIGESDINIDIKKLESDIINIREMNVNKIYGSVPGNIEEGHTKEKIPLKQDMNIQRIEQNVLDSFNKNPYTQSLASY